MRRENSAHRNHGERLGFSMSSKLKNCWNAGSWRKMNRWMGRKRKKRWAEGWKKWKRDIESGL
ncbi:hypothetical protein BT69DRAFT_162128 [Atractiella rhizophila]|nr:hypothetical protein BT69DRAFT_162128 [Atractiella rhizophila]